MVGSLLVESIQVIAFFIYFFLYNIVLYNIYYIIILLMLIGTLLTKDIFSTSEIFIDVRLSGEKYWHERM